MTHFGYMPIPAVKFHICCNKFSSSLDHQIPISSKRFIKSFHFLFILHAGLSGHRRGNQTRSGTWPSAAATASCFWQHLHIPQWTGAVGPLRSPRWALTVLRLFAWESHSAGILLGWTPESFFLLPGCLHLHACLRIPGALLSFLVPPGCIEKQTLVCCQ